MVYLLYLCTEILITPRVRILMLEQNAYQYGNKKETKRNYVI